MIRIRFGTAGAKRILLVPLLSVSCLPWIGGNGSTAPDPTVEETFPAIDSVFVEETVDSLPPVSTETEPAPPPPPAPRTEAAPTPPDDPPPSFTLRLSVEERARLLETTTREMEETEKLLERVRQGPRSGEAEVREVIRTVQDLLKGSREALDTDDLTAAAELAKKARVLAEGIAPPGTP